MRLPLVLAAGLFLASPLRRRNPAPSTDQPVLRVIAADVDPKALESTIKSLVGFGTRHTLSDTKSETRGIGAARRWAKGRFQAISKDCGGCLTIETPSETVTGRRVPNPTEVMDVLAIQKGTSDPDRVIIIAGHIDSRVNDVMDFTSDAPGANDDASGTAAVIEAARVLSKHKFPATLVFAVLSGEEQGLLGRQGAGQLRQGPGLEGRGRPQQRHRRQQPGHQRGDRQHPRADLLGRHQGRRDARSRPTAAATTAARSTAHRATWPASWTVWPTAT
jgi:hypothetical protein